MRLVLALFILLTASGSSAQTLSVRSVTLKWTKVVTPGGPPEWLQDRWEKGYVVMPYVSGGPPGVAMRINTSLFLRLLDGAGPTEPGDTFTLADPPSGIDSLSFKVRRNDAQVIAFDIKGSGCGASCSEWQSEYHFDARNGHELAIDDLITARGQAILAKRMNRESMAQYQAEARRLAGELRLLRQARKKSDAERTAALKDALAMNRRCLDRTREESHEGRLAGELLLAEPRRVTLRKDAACEGVSFPDPSVTLGSIDLEIPAEELADLLTPYGKALLLSEGDAPPPRSPFGQVLFGQIGGRPVTARLDRPFRDGSFAALYFYEKYRRAIELSGRMEGAKIEIVEKLPDGEEATFLLTEKDGGLVGTWTGRDKQLSVALRP